MRLVDTIYNIFIFYNQIFNNILKLIMKGYNGLANPAPVRAKYSKIYSQYMALN